MVRGLPNRTRVVCLVLCALAWGCVQPKAFAQADPATTSQLLGKAHALEVRGRMDMAKQTWQQVLLVDPNNTEALAGMARAAKLEGKSEEATQYLNKLRAINPNDPNIARVETMGTAQDMSAQLQEAGRLSQAGQYARAMTILRQIYGTNPPAGDAALSYYQTEAATEDGRPHAIAGLRDLIDKYPQDSRYQVTLGKILTYNPRTRAEGRKLLERHPNDPDAVEALRQSLVWDAANPATSGEVRAYLAKHKDQQLQTALAQEEAQAKRSGGGVARPSAPPPTPEQEAAQAELRSRNAESQAAYNALNAKRYGEAETRFQAILAKEPQSAQALAGLGYIRMSQSNFGGAISYLEQAEQDGSRDAGVEKALRDSRFFYTMQVATAALNENDLSTAETQFENASRLRPNDPSPLLGLGGTLMKAQQPEPAVRVFSDYVRMSPSDKAAWRGLFMAQYGAGLYPQALDTDKRIPTTVKKQLMRDPEYLRTLASVYQALGRDADAQRVLRSALDLPFPADARGVKADMQLQYAALLAAAGHKDQAAGLYRQVLEADSTNINAYEGLVNTEHTLGQDAVAFGVIQSMPPQTYETAMQEPGFQATVAAIYHGQGHDDLAQQVLETSLANEQQNGQKPSLEEEVQLAGLYLQHGDTEHAYPLYRSVLQSNPERTEAWNGLLTSLHSTGHDQEALAEIQQIPPNVRLKLESDPAYLQTVGSIYSGLNQPAAAMSFFSRVQQHYLSQHLIPPADIDIQEAWLLYNSKNDPMLYRQLMTLGGRQDLTDQQRLTVQTIWASWAVRRANQQIDQGHYKRAIAILNAAAKAFPGNPDVLKALASGYATAGLAKQAVSIFKSQDMSTGSAADYKAAVGAALAANDLKDSETWLRFGLNQYPRDGQLLALGAKFETARGDAGRATDYYRASLSALPQDDPGLQLSDEMSHPVRRASQVPSSQQSQDLATLLSQADPAAARDVITNDIEVQQHPYLPSYTGGGNAPVQIQAQPGYGTQPYGTQRPTQSPRNSTLKDYVPQSLLEVPQHVEAAQVEAKTVLYLHPSAAMEAKYGPYVSYDPSEGLPQVASAAREQTEQQVALLDAGNDGITARMSTASFKQQGTYTQPAMYPQAAGASQTSTDSQTTYQAPTYHPPATYHMPANTKATYPQASGTARRSTTAQQTPLHYAQPKGSQSTTTAAPAQPLHLHYTQPARTSQPAYTQPTSGVAPQSSAVQEGQMPDGTPIVSYIQNSKPAVHRRIVVHTPSESVAARAAAIRANQAAAPAAMMGQSHPPDELYDTAPAPDAQIQNTQFSSQPYNPSQMQGSQIPATQPTQQGNSTPQSGGTYQNQNVPPQQTGDSYGQQYPQPNTRSGTAQHTTTRRRVRSTTQESAPALPPAAPLSYPNYQQPLTNQGYPQVGTPYPLGQAPSDYQLQQKSVPPLRGYFDPRVDEQPAPLTDRQQAELDLATIEGSYSGWVGGTANGSYRSGTPGIDRMAGVEVPFEASAVLGKSVRVIAVPMAIFLNAGQLNTTGLTGSTPLFGTVTNSTNTVYAQQFAEGFGGEGQLVTNTFALAGGYSAYGFLVRNVIGRAKWKPGNGHFTLFGGRDPVKETQLSYAGMRDPGQATVFTQGPIWGGVVQTGGGVRFDVGDAKSGFYVQGEGGDLSGYHVLQNRKYDGTMGAYFRVKVWPEYGSLNVGGTVFGEHYDHNERIETYGNGGYFSPDVYFLFAVPVTFTGHYKEYLHYTINGSVGVQTFQEDSGQYYPLDPNFEVPLNSTCTATLTQPCGASAQTSNTGLNYSIDAKVAYQATEHWYIGGFLSGNNTNNYNTISGGFFARYLIRPQTQTVEYPTGLFPVEGFRPLRVP